MSTITDAEAGIPNIAAFLDMLAHSEGTTLVPISVMDGYDVIVTGLGGAPEVFTDFSTHPFANGRAPKVINSRGLASTASGRYQFLLKDWPHYKSLLRLPDFSPLSQDKWAIQLIRERNALVDIRNGRPAVAITKVANLWASLPGANYPGQKMHGMETLLAAYSTAGGTMGKV
jgi:muramidase (phage lysozyme)